MAEYQDMANHMVLRKPDMLWIKRDPDDKDYQEYLAWCEAGNTPDPASVDPYVPPPAPEPQSPPTEVTDAFLYDHENRIRALEGQPALSKKEFTALRDYWSAN
jgi:hypothetical protein